MSQEIRNRINYTVMCIGAFSAHHSLHLKDGYCYLKQYGGISFLKDCYEAEHLLSIEDAVNDLTILCKRNGGNVA